MQVLILVAGVLLCLQLGNALPQMKREAVAIESSAAEDNPQVQLMNYTKYEYAQWSKWMLDHGSVVVRNAVRDLNKIPVKGELLQANITRMSQIATEYSEIDLESNGGIEKLFDWVNNFTTMLVDYDNMPADSELRITLKLALENNGFSEFKNLSMQKFNELYEKFENAINKFIKVLSPAERERHAELIQLYDDFKAETDEEKKAEKLVELFNYLI